MNSYKERLAEIVVGDAGACSLLEFAIHAGDVPNCGHD